MRPLTQDLRRRIVSEREKGQGVGEICRRYRVSRRSVERYWKQHQLSGNCQPKQIGGYRVSRLQKHNSTLQRWIEDQPNLSLAELQQRCLKQLNVRIGLNGLWHHLKRIGLSNKKIDARRRESSS